MNTSQPVANVDSVASAISDYLSRYPAASDTIEGICTWWLAPQRDEVSVEVVKAALDNLVNSGEVIATDLDNNRIVYRKSPPNHNDAR